MAGSKLRAARRLPCRQRQVDWCVRQIDLAGIAERNGIRFSFVKFTLYGMPMMIVSIAIGHVYV